MLLDRSILEVIEIAKDRNDPHSLSIKNITDEVNRINKTDFTVRMINKIIKTKLGLKIHRSAVGYRPNVVSLNDQEVKNGD